MAHHFEIYKDKADEYRVRFSYNSEVMFSTQGYSSKASAENAIASIKKNDLARLTRIPGVGKKTAERILLELKDKLCEFGVDESDRSNSETDVISAMDNLGYNRGMIEAAIKRVLDGGVDPGFDELFKRTLQILTKG